MSVPLCLAPWSTLQPSFIRNELVFSNGGISIAASERSPKLVRLPSLCQAGGGGGVLSRYMPQTCLPDPHKTTLAKEEAGRTLLLFSESPFEEGDVSSAPLNRLMWEAVIFVRL